MNNKQGYFRIATIRSVPIFLHWSFPAAFLFLCFAGTFRLNEWLYYFLAYAVLILVHESGHLLAALSLRLKVYSVDISGNGGLCKFDRPKRIRESVLVYSGGLVAQFVVFLLVIITFNFMGIPASGPARAVYIIFTYVNIGIFIINFIPGMAVHAGSMTDGTVLWRLFMHVSKNEPHPSPPLVITPFEEAPVFPPDTSLIKKPGFLPAHFIHGIEVLSDRTTPMDFVVSCFMKYLGLSSNEATVLMLDIHNNGGMLIPLPSRAKAVTVARAIAEDAQAAGHALICRYVGS